MRRIFVYLSVVAVIKGSPNPNQSNSYELFQSNPELEPELRRSEIGTDKTYFPQDLTPPDQQTTQNEFGDVTSRTFSNPIESAFGLTQYNPTPEIATHTPLGSFSGLSQAGGSSYGGYSTPNTYNTPVLIPHMYYTSVPYISGYKMTPIYSEKQVVVKDYAQPLSTHINSGFGNAVGFTGSTGSIDHNAGNVFVSPISSTGSYFGGAGGLLSGHGGSLSNGFLSGHSGSVGGHGGSFSNRFLSGHSGSVGGHGGSFSNGILSGHSGLVSGHNGLLSGQGGLLNGHSGLLTDLRGHGNGLGVLGDHGGGLNIGGLSGLMTSLMGGGPVGGLSTQVTPKNILKSTSDENIVVPDPSHSHPLDLNVFFESSKSRAAEEEPQLPNYDSTIKDLQRQIQFLRSMKQNRERSLHTQNCHT